MSPNTRSLGLVCLVVSLFIANAYGQDPNRVLGEVTVHADDAVYKELRTLSTLPDLFSGDYATVSNVVLKRDAGSFTLASGEIYFIKPIGGRVTAGVFIGTGEFVLTPPTAAEQKHLAIFTGGPAIKESFDAVTMFFTDDSYKAIKGASGVTIGKDGAQSGKALSLYREKEKLLRTLLRYNMSSRILADLYAPKRTGFFSAFIDGSKFGKLIYNIDPQGIAEVYPEQVELISYGDNTGGIWTAFHLSSEYAKGTGVSWADRRSYDIIHHDVDMTISGTKIEATDLVTIEMREDDVRFLPFDLVGSLRVSAVTDEAGNTLPFIQEKKSEDSDLGVILPEPKAVGKAFKVKIAYEGSEALSEAGGGNYILLPRSTWYPNNPVSSFGDRARFDITFRYPKRFLLAGVGDRVGEETVEGDKKVAKWSSGQVDLAVAGFNFGDFKSKTYNDPTTGLQLEVFTNWELPDEIKNVKNQLGRNTTLGSLNTSSMADTVLNEAENATRIYNAYFGRLPYKRIAMTQQPAGFFGQAWPTLVFMPYTAFFGDTYRVQIFGIGNGTNGFWREVAAHEVAHQWWGHSVGWTSYRDQWMSEGFSEFSTSLYIQYVKKDTKKFLDFWEGQRQQIIQATPRTLNRAPYTVGPVTQGYRLNSAKTGAVAQSMIYPKGAFILHMIRMMMFDGKGGTGDQRFQVMMRDFIATHFNKDVSTNDFKLAVEKHMLPAMDLDKNKKMDWFFDEYVYGTEMPSYKFTYSLKPGGDGKTLLSAKIEQSGVSDNFIMRVPIYVDLGKGWVTLGAATVVGNSSQELKDIALPGTVKAASIAAFQDVLALKIENVKQ